MCTCSLRSWSGWRCRGVVILVGVPSHQRPHSEPHGCSKRQSTDISSVKVKYFPLANTRKKHYPWLKMSPVIQVGALGPLQWVGSDAAASCNTPGTCHYWGTRTLSQVVDHCVGQLCLFHHLLDLLQLLVIGPPPGGCCCSSYSTRRPWTCQTGQCFPKLPNGTWPDAELQNYTYHTGLQKP